jgi:Bacterial virulence factor lipase N-terminal
MQRLTGFSAAFVISAVGLGGCSDAGVMAMTERRVQSTVRPLLDLHSRDRSPFPSDAFTVADANQNTGRRVNLPTPQDCATHPSDCEDVAVLNQLDGFNMQARISVPFDGDIDPATVTSKSVFLLKLRDVLTGREDGRQVVGINYIVWDSATRELSFRPDGSLDQHTTYVLVVTTGVRDERGNAIGVAQGLREDRDKPAGDADRDYRRTLDRAEQRARPVLARGVDIATLSVFTTQTATHIVERMRAAIYAAPAPTLNVNVGPGGTRAVFADATIAEITNNADINVGGALTPQTINLAQWRRIVPGKVGTVAFGTFRTLDFTAGVSGHVPPIPTRTGTLAVTGELDVAFTLWLPTGPPPPGGWPVYIYAHGSFGDKNSGARIAAIAASQGLATITINAIGRGFGARTTMTVRRTDGTTLTFPAPGLGRDQNGDNVIDDWEPFGARRPNRVHNLAGPTAETVAQHFALVRALQAGVDVDGDGAPDLSGSRIYMSGGSFGAMVAMLTLPYEPAVRAAAFVVPGGMPAYHGMLGPALRGMFGTAHLASRTPSLINSAHGVTSIDGIPVSAPFYNDDLPLRDQPPRVNIVPGAVAIQRVVDRIVWAGQYASSLAFARLVRRAPLAGVPARPFLLQYPRSDQTVANPMTADLIRAGDFADRVSFYRHDLNFGLPGVPADPHAYFTTINAANPNYYRIMLGAQHQVATFFASDGATVMHPTPTELWEVPIKLPVPADTYYLPRPR